MFVCLCNGFTERQVRQCLNEGVNSVSGVYRTLGPVQCGKCICHVRDMVSQARDQTGTATTAASEDRLPIGAVPALA
jgi:bacterioferritin-associated ferredoxin